jgi:hypothetical protein
MLVHLPPQHAGSDSGGMAHIRQRARSVPGGKYMPALAMASCATCQLARHAAIKRGSFLTKNFVGGLFWQSVGGGGLIGQKFILSVSMRIKDAQHHNIIVFICEKHPSILISVLKVFFFYRLVLRPPSNHYTHYNTSRRASPFSPLLHRSRQNMSY